ncbi:unnamed protein product [Allacma fusca]|uniref:Uncharacterized protein n=1 Tax=Allacma fusca TaxID=39272 RepID=A0A8J2PB52_9HEXA|nr:unnamed protein product [Allacma fusca]
MLIPIIYLFNICFLASILKVQHYPEQDESYETPLNLMYTGKSRFNSTNSITEVKTFELDSAILHITPNTPFTQDFTKEMQLVWNRQLPIGMGSKLTFVFHHSENDLVKDYLTHANNTLTHIMGLILPTVQNPEWNSEFKFKYVIRLPPDQVPSPRDDKKIVEKSTCRELKGKIAGLEPVSSCPINKYWFGNFLQLALQQLVELTVLQKNLISKNPNATYHSHGDYGRLS